MLAVQILLLFRLLDGVERVTALSKELLIPQFEYVPPPITYFDEQSPHLAIPLTCRGWPPQPFSSISYYTVSRLSVPGVSPTATAPRQIPLYPVRETLLTNSSTGLSGILLSNLSEITEMSEQNMHCVISTWFGSILSPPFRLMRAGLVEDRGDGHTPGNHHTMRSNNTTTVIRVYPGNVAVIRCKLPDSQPSASVHFTRYASLLALDSRKHLMVRSISDDYVDLLISSVTAGDQGDYQCVATNPVTKRIHTDSEIFRLVLNDPPKKNFSRLIRGFSDRNELLVKEGANLTLYCLFESWPAKPSSVERVNKIPLDRERYQYDARFGAIFLNEVVPVDEGRYRCVNGGITSSIFVRVKRRTRVTLSPAFVSVSSGSPVTLNCSSSVPSIPVWYFNGRIKQSQRFADFDYHGSQSQLILSAVDARTVGIYQCVVHDSDDNWVSAQSVVGMKTQRPISLADYDKLLRIIDNPKQWRTVVSRPSPSQLVSLSCLPNEPDLTELTHRLSDMLPSHGPISQRLQLAYQLGLITVNWRKDGVQLQLPLSTDESAGPLQLNLTATRSVDLGLYRCEVSVQSRHVLFSHETLVQQSSLKHEVPYKSTPSLEAKQPVPFYSLHSHTSNAHSLTDATGLFSSMPSNLTHMMDPTDRDKRNVGLLPGRGQPSPLKHDAQMRSHVPIGVFIYGDQASDSVRGGHLNLERYPLRPAQAVSPVTRLRRPNVSTIGDNLAALISWPAIKVDFYQVIFRTRLPMDSSWSQPVHTEKRIDECCSTQPSCCQQLKQAYLTSRQRDGLEPGHLYEFRVHAFVDQKLVGKSLWSKTISFEHISKVAPEITETERLPDGGILVRWNLATSAVGFPIDHFLLLYRPGTVLANGEINYEGFQNVSLPSNVKWQYELRNLEPGKGYQIVVYGVHTPPGLDPQMSIFKGGIGGRRITQFSHEIFVKPQDVSGESVTSFDPTLRQSHIQNPSAVRSGADSNVALNSTESNRLMFLILGALAGFMILVMIGLVILCVWRQQRDKQRLLLYCHNTDGNGAGTKSVDGYTGQPQQPRSVPASGPFMLSHLNSLESSKPMDTGTHRSHQLSHRSSVIYPQPPPMSPPPPPPPSALATCTRQEEALEMTSLMSDYSQKHQHPQQHHVPSSSVPCYPIPPAQQGGTPMMVEPHPAYWAAPQLAMTGSKYSGQFIPVNYYPSNSTMPNVPYGLKREPPSGGSVHDGTDTECDMLDQGVIMGQKEHLLQARKPVSMTPDMNSLPYHSLPPPSFAISPGAYMDGPHQTEARYPNDQQQQQQPQQFFNPIHSHPMQTVDGDLNRGYFSAYPVYPTSMAPHISTPGFQVPALYDPGLGTPPMNHGPVYSLDPRIPASRSVEPDYAHREKLCGSLQSENKHHHHRRRRRRLTADSVTSNNFDREEYHRHTETADTSTPLMASSPVLDGHSLRGGCNLQTNPDTEDRPPPLPLHHPSASYGGHMVHPNIDHYPPEFYGKNYPPDQMTNGAPVVWDRAFSSPGWSDPVKPGPELPPDVPAHRPYHIVGPLIYGNHNPGAVSTTLGASTAPNSLTRRIPTSLLNGPPRVRDYSEYGIPNVHPSIRQPSCKVGDGVHSSAESVDPNRGPYTVGPKFGVDVVPADRRFVPLGQPTT